MAKFYKAGSIVPRTLMRAQQRKAQHCLKFGCDVEVTNRRVVAVSEGPAFMVRDVHRRRRNGTKQRCGSSLQGVSVVGLGFKTQAAIRLRF